MHHTKCWHYISHQDNSTIVGQSPCWHNVLIQVLLSATLLQWTLVITSCTSLIPIPSTTQYIDIISNIKFTIIDMQGCNIIPALFCTIYKVPTLLGFWQEWMVVIVVALTGASDPSASIQFNDDNDHCTISGAILMYSCWCHPNPSLPWACSKKLPQTATYSISTSICLN